MGLTQWLKKEWRRERNKCVRVVSELSEGVKETGQKNKFGNIVIEIRGTGRERGRGTTWRCLNTAGKERKRERRVFFGSGIHIWKVGLLLEAF